MLLHGSLAVNIFCNKHGSHAFLKQVKKICPVCNTHLPTNIDTVKTNLNPSDKLEKKLEELQHQLQVTHEQRNVKVTSAK
jgi:uncharacterized Zn finger protein (UPF0148 family)